MQMVHCTSSLYGTQQRHGRGQIIFQYFQVARFVQDPTVIGMTVGDNMFISR